MKTKTNFTKRSSSTWSLNNLSFKSCITIAAIMISLLQPVQAQETKYAKPTWWFGVASGANYNFHRGSTQQLNAAFTAPVAFHNADGVGLYIAPLIGYYIPNSRFGIMLQAGYDNRKGSFNQEITACNCPADLSTKLSYYTIEPSIRFAPFNSNFYIYGGPKFAFNSNKSFTYKQQANPNFPNQIAPEDVKGDFDNIEDNLITMQIGAGYDIPLSTQGNRTQFVLSPFVAFQPYFGSQPRSVETWNVSTLRVGFALKFGSGSRLPQEVANTAVNSKVDFTVTSPKNIPSERRVREIFPLRNYIFFNSGSTEIPSRYQLLKKNQVADFKEDQLEVQTPNNLTGRSQRQMTVYYNVINILGDRMQKNPSTSISLVGSSEKGPKDGVAMAESVKSYLVNVFSINASRINTEGRNKPEIPSKQPGGTRELDLLREGDRRVSIESNSPTLLMEFRTGPDAPLKPVEIVGIQSVPVDSYVTFNNKGAKQAFKSWTLEVKDENGKVQNFGPYTNDEVSFPGQYILGSRPEGDYKIKMIGVTKEGKLVERVANTHLVGSSPDTIEEGIRYSIIYEFNESKAISIYEKYLSEIVTPKIPNGGYVIIHGHTDIIGETDYNQDLSLARANDVKNIIQNSLAKSGRSDVRFEIRGFGEDTNISPFENKFPEERFYNRTVIIDIIPSKVISMK